MKAWKRIHITKKRAACGVLGLLLLAAAYMGVPRAAEKVFAVAEGERRLPIYCVQTEKPQVSVSFDAAWGADDTDELLRILKENDVKATFFSLRLLGGKISGGGEENRRGRARFG